MKCYDFEQMAAFVIDPAKEDRFELVSHIAHCSECRNNFELALETLTEKSEPLPGDEQLSTFQRNAIALEFSSCICHNFQQGKKPFSEEELSEKCMVPIRTTRMILSQLVKGGILTEGISNGDMMIRTYQTARPVEQLTPVKIISALEKSDGATIEGIGNTAFMRKYALLWESAEKSKENSQNIK